jgi:5-methylcytosine-specific restriction endonuclease McrA
MSGLAFPKPSATRDRIADKRLRDKALREAINAVWKRDESYCQACGLRLKRPGGHVHHLTKRSQSKAQRADISNLVLLCPTCHSDVHGYRLVLTGRPGRLKTERTA